MKYSTLLLCLLLLFSSCYHYVPFDRVSSDLESDKMYKIYSKGESQKVVFAFKQDSTFHYYSSRKTKELGQLSAIPLEDIELIKSKKFSILKTSALGLGLLYVLGGILSLTGGFSPF